MISHEHKELNQWWAEKKAKFVANRTKQAYSDWILDYWMKLPMGEK